MVPEGEHQSREGTVGKPLGVSKRVRLNWVKDPGPRLLGNRVVFFLWGGVW